MSFRGHPTIAEDCQVKDGERNNAVNLAKTSPCDVHRGKTYLARACQAGSKMFFVDHLDQNLVTNRKKHSTES